MIVITPAENVAEEIRVIHLLFDAGLHLLHVRKPDFSIKEMKTYLSMIDERYYSCISLHSHHSLANEKGIGRLHFTESGRRQQDDFLSFATGHLSASVHSIDDFNLLPDRFEYAFLSPVFASVSKPGYFPKQDLLNSVKQRANFHTKLVALGGISQYNIAQTLDAGFDDTALLGTIWQSTDPVQKFKQCLQIVQKY